MKKLLGPWAALVAVALIALAFATLPLPAEGQGAAVRESNESIANYAGAAALVEHDTNLIAPNCRALFATSAGNFVVDMAREGTDQTFVVEASKVYPLRIKRFKTASTATGICLY